MTVPDDKIQITILILRRGALSSKDGIEDEDGRRGSLWDYQVETAGLESGSAGNSCFEGHLKDGEFEHPQCGFHIAT